MGKKIGPSLAPGYEFSYNDGKLSREPTGKLDETIDRAKSGGSGLGRTIRKKELAVRTIAERRRAKATVVVFATKTRQL